MPHVAWDDAAGGTEHVPPVAEEHAVGGPTYKENLLKTMYKTYYKTPVPLCLKGKKGWRMPRPLPPEPGVLLIRQVVPRHLRRRLRLQATEAT